MRLKESEHIELKKSTSSINEALISIVSILNKHGKGELYFGVKNNSEIVGQAVTDKTLRSVSQAIANHIEPKIFPTVEKVLINKKEIVKVLFSGVNKPYFAFGRAYMRVADEDRQLSANELKKMILVSEVYRTQWDFKLCDLTLESIEQKTLLSFIQKAINAGRLPDTKDQPQQVLKKLYLCKKNKLSLAAKYLFTSEHPIEIQAAVFAGKDKLTFLDIKKFNLPLLDLLEYAESYLKERMNWRVKFIDFKRVEIPEIPLKALREALVNSIIHRDFNNPKGNELAVYKDRIEIYNPGTFPEGLTPEDYIKNQARSYLRNPLIAEIFYLTKDVEKWGSGLKRIDEECRANNINVNFKVVETGFVTTFIRPVMEEKNLQNISVADTAKDTVKDTAKDTVKLLSKNEKKIVEQIKRNSKITADELSEIVDINLRNIRRNLKKLKKKGLLKRIGPAKGGHWELIDL